MKCIVKDCKNHSHEGTFVGNLCSPCYEFVAKGQGVYSQAYRNTKREWVGLTYEDVYQMVEENKPPQLNTLFDMVEWMAGVIEAKLKEKNT